MINMLMIKLSKDHDIFYMERRTYKEGEIYKSYLINVDGDAESFGSKLELLHYLQDV